ncbi:MAG: enoyl-CoA hydratase [Acidimicrobiales bacterium]
MTPDDVVQLEVADRVATVMLNRPDARNALDTALLRALPKAIAAAEDDPAVDVVILTGADPAFCAGLDLKELGAGGRTLAEGSATGEGHSGGRGPLPAMSKPLIGAVNGPAVTGGFELALMCDLLVASERARFADTHARVGIQPGWGLTVLLPQAVGLRRARELSLTGNFLDAETALGWGLVNHVVAHDELLPFCRKLAADIVTSDQDAMRRILETYAAGALTTPEEAFKIEARAAREWLRAGGAEPEEIERRRAAIIERGHAQL